MEENMNQSEILNSSLNTESIVTPNIEQIDEENVDEAVELLDPVEPIEIEEGMPDDVKEAIMRFNKRTSALREVASGHSNVLDDEESEDDELDEEEDYEDEELENSEDGTIDVSDIEEDDNSTEFGDLF